MRSLSARAGAPNQPRVALPAAARDAATAIAGLAVRSLYDELTLHPKPGLVSLVDNGSHDDMNAATFMRSLFALRHYYAQIAAAGMDGASFARLKQLGIAAERRMLDATGGINTHRGAIFCLGLLAAAAGHCIANATELTPRAIRAALRAQWGAALAEHTVTVQPSLDTHPAQAERVSWMPQPIAMPRSRMAQAMQTAQSVRVPYTAHGQRVAETYAVGGAREEAALGLPSVFEIALPAFEATLAAGRSHRHAQVDALFALMAQVSDTNVYHRAGAEGATIVRRHARDFLAHGGSADPGWMARALSSHRVFIAHRISPGGAADLLAATCFVHALTRATVSAAHSRATSS